MKKGTLLIGVVALMLFFVVAGLVRSFFQFPEDKVKYDLLCVRVEGSSENIWLSFDLSLVASSQAAHIAWPCSPYKFTCENTNQIHSWVFLSK